MKCRLSVLVLFLLGTAFVYPQTARANQEPGGLQPGVSAPSFSLRDQTGKKQNLATLSGPKGLLLLFFRSADWCPFCKGQLVDLESAQKAFAAKGIAVAAVSYDSPAILANFASRRSITYPLLSDSNSSTIDKFGIRNREARGVESGIPYPGFYLINAQGVVQKRFFEEAYVNRFTASNVYAYLFGTFALPLPSRPVGNTPHVAVSTSQSDESVTPGAVVRLVVDLTPGPGTHIYAPGAEKQGYRVTSLTLQPSALYRSTVTNYPASVLYNFPELKETVPVYTGPTAFTTSVSAVVDGPAVAYFAKHPDLAITGELNYQACTATVCFPPVKVPVQWTLTLRPLDLERAPSSLQRQ